MDFLTDDPRYCEARRHVQNVRAFYVHALVYVAVMAGFYALSLTGTTPRLWTGWPLFWGLGVLAHGFSVLVAPALFGAGWEARKIREYLERRP